MCRNVVKDMHILFKQVLFAINEIMFKLIKVDEITISSSNELNLNF